MLSVLVAFLAYSILDLSKAFQKISFEQMARNRLVGSAIWLAATASTTVSSFLLLYAVSLGSVLIVGAMGGTGLAALTLFSVFVMKERAGWREIVGAAVILTGPVVMALFPSTQSGTPLLERLFVYIGLVAAAYVGTITVVRRRTGVVGLVVGGFAGALGGMVLLLQKVSTTEQGRSVAWVSHLGSETSSRLISKITDVLVNPYTVGWIAVSILSTVVLQFSYKHDRAIRIVPMYAANTILIPLIGGMLCFQETLHPVQWGGVLLILIGVGLITVRRR